MKNIKCKKCNEVIDDGKAIYPCSCKSSNRCPPHNFITTERKGLIGTYIYCTKCGNMKELIEKKEINDKSNYYSNIFYNIITYAIILSIIGIMIIVSITK